MKNVDATRIFIGYDKREAVAYHVCVNSIINTTKKPVSITPLVLDMLAPVYEEHHTDGSNAFIYSRFLVPFLCGFTGKAIYLDGDMLVQDDVTQLLDFLRPGIDVAVVKHEYKTTQVLKYLGAKNEDYPRKNWSSVIAWDCSTYPNRVLTPTFIAKQPGSFLHRFAWLADDRIAEIPQEWNWLVGEYRDNPGAKLLHYTLGTPCFAGYRDGEPAAQWWAEWHRMTDAQE